MTTTEPTSAPRPPTTIGAAPLTARGARTRAALVKAARALFERQGYLDTNVGDIAKRTRVAHGTFYTYFTSKEEIFAEVSEELQHQLLAVAENEQYGLTKRDIGHNINFFMNVPVTPDGGLTFADGVSGPGRYVEMRAEMDVIVLISNCPQLNNPCNAYNPTPVRVMVWGPD